MPEPTDENRMPMDWETRFLHDDTPWERGGLNPAFEHWRGQGLFRAGLRVFIPGCGRSLEPEAFSRLGLNVTGLDLSDTAIAWQRARFAHAHLSGQFEVADALRWRPDAPFDLYYEQTFLCAIPPRLRTEYEIAAHEQIRPGGRLLALFMQKEERGGPPYGCAIEDMKALFGEARWDWPDGEFFAFPHPSLGGKAEIAAVLTRRP